MSNDKVGATFHPDRGRGIVPPYLSPDGPRVDILVLFEVTCRDCDWSVILDRPAAAAHAADDHDCARDHDRDDDR